MNGFTLEIDIERPAPELFAFLAAGENTPRWYEAVEEVTKLTPGPVRAGSVYRVTRRLPQGRVVNEVEVSELVADERVTLRSLRGPTPFTYRYTLAATPRGAHLTLDGTISGEGLAGPAAFLAPLAPTLFKRGMAENLRVLKQVLEAR